jgi:hypothetical protein
MGTCVYILVATPPAVTYSTPRAHDDYPTIVDHMDDISEQVQGLEVSSSLDVESRGNIEPIERSSQAPMLTPYQTKYSGWETPSNAFPASFGHRLIFQA